MASRLAAGGRPTWLRQRLMLASSPPTRPGKRETATSGPLAGLTVAKRRPSPATVVQPVGAAQEMPSPFQRVAAAGAGTYVVSPKNLWFSSTDGTDPRANGKRYEVVLPKMLSAQTRAVAQRIWSWGWLALVLIFGHFFLPFFLLLNRDLKRNVRTLSLVAMFILAIRLADVFWLIGPAHGVTHISIHWLDLVAPVALGGLFVTVFLWQLGTRPIVPVGEPWLNDAIEQGAGH